MLREQSGELNVECESGQPPSKSFELYEIRGIMRKAGGKKV